MEKRLLRLSRDLRDEKKKKKTGGRKLGGT